MRNLKRALSLALASVMLLGMMVVGTSAASYPDIDENDNVEAIEVLNAVNVMIGDRGNFRPDAKVNRHEMAVIMAKLVLGNDVADNYVGSHPFTDTFPWADKYVAACYENGIVAGTSKTTFSGNKNLTAVEAAGMMLNALGYKDLNKGADDWRTPLVAMANQLRLFNGVTANPKEELTRNQVAQLVLNTLKSPVVDLKDGTFTATDGKGQLIISGGSREYIVRSSMDAYARAISAVESKGNSASSVGGYTIELGEHLYNGKLKLNTNAKDKFGRPSNNWQYDGKDVGTYVNNDLKVAEYTKKVTGADLYDLLTYTTINDNDLLTWLDGVKSTVSKTDLVRSNKKAVNSSGTGVLTEVFVDLDHDEVTISSINTYLAKANSDYNSTNETLSLKVYEASASGTTKTVDVKDVPAAAGVKKGDYKLVYLSGWDTSAAQKEVVEIFDTEILSDSEVTKWSKDSTKVLDTLTTGGQEYSSNVKAFYDRGKVFADYNQQLLTDNTYNIYLDRYGNVIGVDLHEGTKNYVFITGYDRIGSNISIKTADAAAIFLDGTMEVITVNVTDTNKNIDAVDGTIDQTDNDDYFKFWKNYATDGKRNENRWYTYTVNSAGVYTLTPATRMFATDYRTIAGWTKTLDCANLYVDDNGTVAWNDTVGTNPINSGTGDRALGEDASIYITVDTGRVDTSVDPTDTITDVNGVYTGAQDVKLELSESTQNKVPNAVYTVYDADGYIIAAIVLGEAQGAATNYAYMLGEAKNERIEREGSTRAAGDVTYYWEFDAVYEGEKQTLQAKTKFPGSLLVNKYTVQELRFTGDYVTDVKTVANSKFQTTNNDGTKIADMKVYDVGQVTGSDWASNNIGNLDNTNTNLKNETYYNGSTPARIGGTSDATVYLQGRTLYTKTGGVRDIGLALARDAKAVTIQMEDGERTVTNHASVDGAIDRLADRSDNDGVQFKGRIVAVLDGRGVAEWVVFISDTELVTGKDPSYGGGGNGAGNVENEVAFLTGASANATYTISKTGILKLKLTYTAPDFAVKSDSTGSVVKMPAIDVYEGTTLIDTITAAQMLAAANNGGKVGADGKATFSFSSAKYDFDEDKVTNPNNLTFKLTATETLSKVVVKYIGNNNKDLTPYVTADSPKALNTVTSGVSAADVKIAIDNTKWKAGSTATFTSASGLTIDTTDGDETYATAGTSVYAAPGSEVSILDGTTPTALATGTSAVVIKIDDSLIEKPTTYTVTVSDKNAKALSTWNVTGDDAGKTLTFAVDGGTINGDAHEKTGIAVNGEAKITATLSDDPAATGIFGYKVTCRNAKLGAPNKAILYASNLVATWTFRVNENITVSPSDFTVTPITALKITDIEWNAGEIRVTFNKEVDSNTVDTTNFAFTQVAGGPADADETTVALDPANKRVVVIKANDGKGDFAATDTVTILKAVAAAGETGNTVKVAPNDTSAATPSDVAVGNTGYTVTLADGGTATVASKA